MSLALKWIARALVPCVVAGIVAPLGCNTKTQEPEDTTFAVACGAACADLQGQLPVGCVVACGVNIGVSYSGNAGVAVGDVAVDIAGGSNGADTCQSATSCVLTPCQQNFMACIATGVMSDCIEGLAACDLAATCDGALGDCDEEADSEHEQCLADTDPTMWEDVCDIPWQTNLETCECIHGACLAGETPDCTDSPEPMIPLPTMTGPGRYTLVRGLIDMEIARLDALRTETGVTRELDLQTGAVRGVHLWSVDPGEVLFAMGLRSNDVVLSINGHPMAAIIGSPAMLSTLHDAAQWQVVVERGQATKLLTYRILN